MPVFSSIDVSEDIKHGIANGIFMAVTHDIPDLIRDYNLPTNNGIGLFRWNFLHKRVEENLGGRFQSKYVARGPWRLLLLYEQELGFTFSVMAEKNLAGLRERLPINIHYLESLVSNNIGYEAIEGQLRLEGCNFPRNAQAIGALRDKLLSDFSGIIKNHILILFDYNISGVISARAVLLTPELDVAFSEDWSKHLKNPYVIGQDSILEEMVSDGEPLVKIKEGKLKEQTDTLVSIAEPHVTSSVG